MRYKEIARQIILSRGIHQDIEPEDGTRHHPDGRKFTPKQVGKIQENFDASVAWLKKKWRLDEE